jgi:hypothetical protein
MLPRFAIFNVPRNILCRPAFCIKLGHVVGEHKVSSVREWHQLMGQTDDAVTLMIESSFFTVDLINHLVDEGHTYEAAEERATDIAARLKTRCVVIFDDGSFDCYGGKAAEPAGRIVELATKIDVLEKELAATRKELMDEAMKLAGK